MDWDIYCLSPQCLKGLVKVYSWPSPLPPVSRIDTSPRVNWSLVCPWRKGCYPNLEGPVGQAASRCTLVAHEIQPSAAVARAPCGGRGIVSSPPRQLEVPPPSHPVLGVSFLLSSEQNLASQDPLGWSLLSCVKWGVWPGPGVDKLSPGVPRVAQQLNRVHGRRGRLQGGLASRGLRSTAYVCIGITSWLRTGTWPGSPQDLQSSLAP